MDHNMIMNSESLAPFVINLPYGQYSREAFEKAFDESLEKQMGRSVNDSDLEHFMLRYVLAYPTVYVVYSGKTNRYSMKNEYTVYVAVRPTIYGIVHSSILKEMLKNARTGKL